LRSDFRRVPKKCPACHWTLFQSFGSCWRFTLIITFNVFTLFS
jgi:hypothetical protein